MCKSYKVGGNTSPHISRHWVFTSYSEHVFDFDKYMMSYLVYQPEKCPKTGKLHWQGYVIMKNKKRMKWMKKHIDDKAHWEKKRGNAKQASDYCKKNDTRVGDKYYEFGKLSYQGKRNDLDDVYDMIKSGKEIGEVIDEFPSSYIKFHRGIEKVKFEVDRKKVKRYRKISVYVIHGGTGTGKTRYAYDEYGYDNVYCLDQDKNVWFDGYCGEKVLLIDDFNGYMSFRKLLKVLDGYPYKCAIKGGYTWAQWTTVIITSNEPPELWYDEDIIKPLFRRISKVIKK